MNKQRESVYALRRELLEGKIQLRTTKARRRVDTPRVPDDARRGARSTSIVETYAGEEADSEEWDLDALQARVSRDLRARRGRARRLDFDDMTPEEIRDALWEPIRRDVRERRKRWSPTEILRRVERDIMLQIVDAQWKDHLYSLDHLKEGIGLRGYGQRDPLVEYKKESFALFQAMKDRVDEEIVRYLWWLDAGRRRGGPGVRQSAGAAPRRPPPMTLSAPSAAVRVVPVRRDARRRRRRAGRPRQQPRARRASAATTRSEDGAARRAEGRPQRPVPVRQRKEIQEVPWSGRLTWKTTQRDRRPFS